VRHRAKVTIESLYEVVYEKWIGTKMNDLDLRLEVISRSRQPVRDIRRRISRKRLEIEAWFQRTNNRKWHMGYIKWSRDRRRHVTLTGQTRDPNTLRAQCLENAVYRMYTVVPKDHNSKWHMDYQMVT